MTGWAQVNGLRGNTSLEERVSYDRYYIENWSLGLDFKIILKNAMGNQKRLAMIHIYSEKYCRKKGHAPVL